MQIITIGASGADFASFQAAVNSVSDPTDDVTFKAITATAFDAGGLNINCSNAHARRLIFTAQAGVQFRNGAAWPVMETAWGQGARITGALTVSTGGVEIYDLATVSISHGGPGTGFQGDGLLVNGSINNPSNYNNLTYLSNVAQWGPDNGSSGLYWTNGVAVLVYCSFWGAGSAAFGLYSNTADAIYSFGCVVQGYGDGSVGGNHHSGDYNISDDGAMPGAHSATDSGMFAGTTGGSIDLHIAPAKAGTHATPDESGNVPNAERAALDVDGSARTFPTDPGDDQRIVSTPPTGQPGGGLLLTGVGC
jgi:hypothetical protein